MTLLAALHRVGSIIWRDSANVVQFVIRCIGYLMNWLLTYLGQRSDTMSEG